MSARTDLLEQLSAALPSSTYRISDDGPDSSTRLATGRAFITAQRSGAVPANVSRGWGQALSVYLLVGAEKFSNAEDELDIHLPVVVAVLEEFGYPISSIDRDTFFEAGDGNGLHGYRIILTAITTTL